MARGVVSDGREGRLRFAQVGEGRNYVEDT